MVDAGYGGTEVMQSDELFCKLAHASRLQCAQEGKHVSFISSL